MGNFLERITMKTIEIQLSNPLNRKIKPVIVKAIVNHRLSYFGLPKALCEQLGLAKQDNRTIGLEMINERTVDYVGPIQVSRKKAVSFCGAVIDGDMPTIGTIVLDDLLDAGVVYDVHSKNKTVSEGMVNHVMFADEVIKDTKTLVHTSSKSASSTSFLLNRLNRFVAALLNK